FRYGLQFTIPRFAEDYYILALSVFLYGEQQLTLGIPKKLYSGLLVFVPHFQIISIPKFGGFCCRSSHNIQILYRFVLIVHNHLTYNDSNRLQKNTIKFGTIHSRCWKTRHQDPLSILEPSKMDIRLLFSRTCPVNAEVTVELPKSSTPLHEIHLCVARKTTPTSLVWSEVDNSCKICIVKRSCTWGLRA